MKKGDIVVLKGDECGAHLEGIRAIVRRRSQRTGNLSVELIEDGLYGTSYRKGSTLVIQPYQCRSSMIVR